MIDRLNHAVARVAAPAMILLLAGCYPVRVTQQPKLEFHVQDAGGQLITDAAVHLARHPDSGRSFVGGDPAETTVQTDRTGRVRFKSMHDWQMEILLPDAYATHYLWSWCIEKESYLPSMQNRVVKSDVPSKAIVVKLELTAESSGCSTASRDGFHKRQDIARNE